MNPIPTVGTQYEDAKGQVALVLNVAYTRNDRRGPPMVVYRILSGPEQGTWILPLNLWRDEGFVPRRR